MKISMAEYYFNLPDITKLTIPQQSALNETKQIALSGGPGTGKSVVLLWRHIANFENKKESLLLTYTTTLKEYLKRCCKNTNAAKNVETAITGKPSSANELTEVIIDEAQDLHINYYEELKGVISKVSYGADNSQILYPEQSTKEAELRVVFPDNKEYVLDKNFRSTKCIMDFAKTAFPDAYIPRAIIEGLANNIGEFPVLLVSGWYRDTSNEKQDEAIIEIINQLSSETHNIAVLVPWKKHAMYFEDRIKSKFPEYSIYYNDDERFSKGCSEIKNVHITTFKSAKGLEFDTVIIPNFQKLLKMVLAERESKYHCSWSDLYVAITRARSNLYLFSNEDMSEFNAVTQTSIL
jgi:DNA helicase IV